MLRQRAITSLAAMLTGFLSLSSATAAFEGKNGRIVWADYGHPHSGTRDLYAIEPNGTGRIQLTDSEHDDFEPAWSPDGSLIAFASNRKNEYEDEIWVMKADGSNPTQLTSIGAVKPAWSPDGKRIAFGLSGSGGIGVMNADGTELVIVTPPNANADDPRFSPDGQRLAYWSSEMGSPDIFTMRPDGTDKRRLTTDPGLEFGPDWSPDGSKIVFEAQRVGEDYFELYVMDADGSNEIRLTTSPDRFDVNPVWSPDGTKIAWEICGGSTPGGIHTMDPDGSNVSMITTLGVCTGAYIDWQTIPLPAVKEVSIDVQPWDSQNRIGTSRWSIVAVAFLSEEGFDATRIDAGSACFGPSNSSALPACGALFGFKLATDVDADGDDDVVLFFSTSQTKLAPGDEHACATAEAGGETRVRGCSKVLVE